VRREPVAAARPALGPAEGEHPGVLARAVVLQRGRPAFQTCTTALELVLRRRRLREQAPDGGQLFGGGEVRRGGDRDLLARQVVARTDERERLERLRRRTEIRDATGVARLLDHLAVSHHDGMDDVGRLDDSAPPHDHLDRVHRGSLCFDKRATSVVWSGIVAHSPLPLDYDAADTLVVSEPAQLRALSDEVRGRIIALLRERAASASELGGLLKMPKGTVGHHLKVLERAGLVHVVRTRRVRAVTEKYYGRVARLFIYRSCDEDADELLHGVGATSLRIAAAEVAAAPEVAMHALLRVRLDVTAAKRFNRRLDKLVADGRAAETADGEDWGLAAAFYRSERR
jgi:DNA-binding transcriptional ArsR family regulator